VRMTRVKGHQNVSRKGMWLWSGIGDETDVNWADRR
jgi:hypothetical protein